VDKKEIKGSSKLPSATSFMPGTLSKFPGYTLERFKIEEYNNIKIN
jgi:hypothetical protein